MLAQYVHPSSIGLFRIVRHGHRWRVLNEKTEIGRYDDKESALASLREQCPQARLPASLERWRFLPQLALVHARASHEDVMPWATTA